jgi:hypothetical protein
MKCGTYLRTISQNQGNVLTLLMLNGLVTRMRSRVRSFLVGTFTL